ncbi:hypothetical protein Gogos_021979 [Gossypium gossypioides]|uniref:Uncharacterized protein n=1 Tax=Gossypium gossypioides TaxID=34282 RepID=A0A7J9D0J6_GOSGO|nr:hypothetical protein [Gossypium gossypioides]
MRNIEAKNLQKILKKFIVSSSMWTVSKNGTHTYPRDSALQ